MFDNRKVFEEPELEVVTLLIADVITTSGDDDDEDWGMGEYDF